MICVTLFSAGTWASYWAEIRNDQNQLIQVGQCVYDGGTLYADCWENKPPGLFWLNALALLIGGGNPRPAWILPGVIGLAGVFVTAFAIRHTVGVVAASLAALLAAAVMSLRSYDAASINPDFYATAFALPGAALWLSAVDIKRTRGVWWRGLIGGLFFAAATLIKQTGALGILSATVITVIVVLFDPGARRWVGATAMLWVGFLIGLGGAGYALFRTGTLEAAYDAVFRFNTSLLDGGRIAGLVHEWPRITQWCEPVLLPLMLAFVGLLGTPVTTDRRVARPVVITLLIWWAVEFVLAMIGPSGSMRYLQGTFAPMTLLAAVGISLILRSFIAIPARLRAAPAVLCMVAVWLTGGPLLDAYAGGLARSYVASQQQPTERDRLEVIASRVRELAPGADDAIYVWNYDSGIYVSADRPCASPYTHPRSAEQMQAILSALKDGKAKVLLIRDGGSHHFDIWCDDLCDKTLKDYLSLFDAQGTVEQYSLWVWRRSSTVTGS